MAPGKAPSPSLRVFNGRQQSLRNGKRHQGAAGSSTIARFQHIPFTAAPGAATVPELALSKVSLDRSPQPSEMAVCDIVTQV